MKFSRLLAVGHSFRKAAPEGRYRMEELKPLPRFESPERASLPAVSASVLAAPAIPAARPVSAPSPVSAAVQSAVPMLRALQPVEPWWRRWFSRSAKGRALPPVQTELRLEAVRVVRNDLSDSDLEIVAAASVSPFVPEAVATPTQPLLGMASSVPAPAPKPVRWWRRWLGRQR